MPRHGLTLRRKSLADLPALKPDIVATGSYYDAAVTQPERLGLELVLDGNHANPGSIALTHMAVAGRDGDGILLRDDMTGEEVRLTRRRRRQCRRSLDRPGQRRARHRPEIYRRHQGVAPHTRQSGTRAPARRADGLFRFGRRADLPRLSLFRPCARRLHRHSRRRSRLRGLRRDGSRLHAGRPRRHVPGRRCRARSRSSTAIAAFDRCRPPMRTIPATSAATTRSARDILPGGSAPVLSLIGGKWTTFRGFAEEAADLVLDRLGKSRRISTRHARSAAAGTFPQTTRNAGTGSAASPHPPGCRRTALPACSNGTEPRRRPSPNALRCGKRPPAREPARLLAPRNRAHLRRGACRIAGGRRLPPYDDRDNGPVDFEGAGGDRRRCRARLRLVGRSQKARDRSNARDRLVASRHHTADRHRRAIADSAFRQFSGIGRDRKPDCRRRPASCADRSIDKRGSM